MAYFALKAQVRLYLCLETIISYPFLVMPSRDSLHVGLFGAPFRMAFSRMTGLNVFLNYSLYRAPSFSRYAYLAFAFASFSAYIASAFAGLERFRDV